MAMNQNVFLHETDRAAMDALKAIPGFSQVTKAFMSGWSEKMMYMENLASYVRISEDQLPRYHAMLKEISEKLGIETPDLFLKLDVLPNAYTAGDTKPFIVITSGLLETIPDELIPCVLAHECGHIVCHHVLYRTMGSWILSGAMALIPLSAALIWPVMNAFRRWMRCSELSADRAAVLCMGGPDQLIEMCMRFAGFTKKVNDEMNVEAFMKQAEEFSQFTSDNVFNKTMEHLRFSQATHPIHAVRAYECRKWTQSEDYLLAKEYFEAYQKKEKPSKLPVSWNKKSFTGRSTKETMKALYDLGFEHIALTPSNQGSLFIKENDVLETFINGSGDYQEGNWIDADAKIELKYYLPDSSALSKKSRSTGISLKHSSAWYTGRPYEESEKEFVKAGFRDVRSEAVYDLDDPADERRGRIIRVSLGNDTVFRQGELVAPDVEIVISYHDIRKD